ncbi:MAG: deaminase [Actinomycetota bacterium]
MPTAGGGIRKLTGHGPARDRSWLEVAIDLARRCPGSEAAFSVGAVIVDADGHELSRGYSRENDPHVHAEESALGKLDSDDPRLTGATMYSSLEPCSERKSRPRACTQLILAARIPRVVFAWREPAVFVEGHGAEELAAAGVTVVEVPELAEAARDLNAHLLDGT